MAAWVIIFGSLATAMENNPKMPDWISGVVLGEFAMFIGFGIIIILRYGHCNGVNTTHRAFLFFFLIHESVLFIEARMSIPTFTQLIHNVKKRKPM